MSHLIETQTFYKPTHRGLQFESYVRPFVDSSTHGAFASSVGSFLYVGHVFLFPAHTRLYLCIEKSQRREVFSENLYMLLVSEVSPPSTPWFFHLSLRKRELLNEKYITDKDINREKRKIKKERRKKNKKKREETRLPLVTATVYSLLHAICKSIPALPVEWRTVLTTDCVRVYAINLTSHGTWSYDMVGAAHS